MKKNILLFVSLLYFGALLSAQPCCMMQHTDNKHVGCQACDSIDVYLTTSRLDDARVKYLIERKTVEIDGEVAETVYFMQGIDTIYTWEAKSIWGDSNSLSVNIGDFDIEGDTLILYNFWAKAGDAPISPYGARIQRYKLCENGSISFISGEIYIETMPDYYIYQKMGKEELGYNSGSLFVRKTPNTEEKEAILRRYIQGVEEEYDAHFVCIDEARMLFQIVRMRLSKLLDFYTGQWRDTYHDNGFGFKN